MSIETVVTAPVSAALQELPARVDRFVVLGRLGRGGMGEVLAAHDPVLDRPVALKLIAADGDGSTALLDEARAQAKVEHANVVAVYDAGVAAGQPWIAMERIDGEHLRARFAAVRDPSARLRLVLAAGAGLAAAHARGLVHRDVKPENVLVGRDGRARVADFGLAAAAGRPCDGGTPGYAAPEQERGDPTDARADQFAFAVMAWEALAGARPIGVDGEPVTPRPPVPRRYVRALERALDPDPARRWPSLPPLLAALAPPPRRRWIAAAGLGVVAGITAGALLAADSPAPSACALEARSIGRALGAERRAALVAAPGYSALGEAAATALERHLAGWRDAAGATCADPGGAACLSEARGQVEALIDQAIARGPAAAPFLLGAIASLPRPGRCAGGRQTDPSDRALAGEIAAALASLALGGCDQARERLRAIAGGRGAPKSIDDAAASRSVAVDHALAAALAEIECGDRDGIRGALRRAREVAAAAGDDHGQAAAWLAWIQHVVVPDGELAAAETALELASDLIVRAGNPPELADDVPFVQALIARARGQHDRAIELLEARFAGPLSAIELAETRSNLGVLRHDRGDLRGALAVYDLAARDARERLGPRHPLTGRIEANRCGTAHLAGDREAAKAACDAALAAVLPPIERAIASINAARVALASGERAAALGHASAAVAITSAPAAAEHRRGAFLVHADALLASRRPEDAAASFRAAIAVEHVADPAGDAGLAHHGLGRIAGAAGRDAEAAEHFTAAAAILDAAPAASRAHRIGAHTAIGHARSATGERAAAAASYRAALALAGEPADAPAAAMGLARIELAAGRRAEARALLEPALPRLAGRNRMIALLVLADAVAPIDRGRALDLVDEAAALASDDADRTNVAQARRGLTAR